MSSTYPRKGPRAAADAARGADAPKTGLRSDEELLSLAREGRQDAFAELVKRYEAPLFNYISRMLGGTADADDVFQETFLRVYRHMNRFWNRGVFRPWVYRIATNLCRDHQRKRSRHPKVSLDAAKPEGSPLQERLESHQPGPDTRARETELAEALESALGKLPEKHRAVFLMARYDDMRYEEIARTLRIPVGTVKSRMNKAVNVLLESVEKTMQ